ncbi:uncharacterized [Tachysurus ichikawai]
MPSRDNAVFRHTFLPRPFGVRELIVTMFNSSARGTKRLFRSERGILILAAGDNEPISMVGGLRDET